MSTQPSWAGSHVTRWLQWTWSSLQAPRFTAVKPILKTRWGLSTYQSLVLFIAFFRCLGHTKLVVVAFKINLRSLPCIETTNPLPKKSEKPFVSNALIHHWTHVVWRQHLVSGLNTWIILSYAALVKHGISGLLLCRQDGQQWYKGPADSILILWPGLLCNRPRTLRSGLVACLRFALFSHCAQSPNNYTGLNFTIWVPVPVFCSDVAVEEASYIQITLF